MIQQIVRNGSKIGEVEEYWLSHSAAARPYYKVKLTESIIVMPERDFWRWIQRNDYNLLINQGGLK